MLIALVIAMLARLSRVVLPCVSRHLSVVTQELAVLSTPKLKSEHFRLACRDILVSVGSLPAFSCLLKIRTSSPGPCSKSNPQADGSHQKSDILRSTFVRLQSNTSRFPIRTCRHSSIYSSARFFQGTRHLSSCSRAHFFVRKSYEEFELHPDEIANRCGRH